MSNNTSRSPYSRPSLGVQGSSPRVPRAGKASYGGGKGVQARTGRSGRVSGQAVHPGGTNPRPRTRRRRITKEERLQYLLRLNQKDGRRSGVMRPINWFMTCVAFMTFVGAAFIVIQAMMVGGAEFIPMVQSIVVAVCVGLVAGWIHVLTSALRRSSMQAKESYFATLGVEPTKGKRITAGAFKRLLHRFVTHGSN